MSQTLDNDFSLSQSLPSDKQASVLHITVNRRLAQFITQQEVESRLDSLPSQQALSTKGEFVGVCDSLPAWTLNDWWQNWQDWALLHGSIPVGALPKKVLTDFEAQWFMERALQAVLNPQVETAANPQEPTDSVQSAWQDMGLLNISQTAKKLYQAYVMAEEYLPEDWDAQNRDESTRLFDLPQESQLLLAVREQYLAALKAKKLWDPVMLQRERFGWLQQQLTTDLMSDASKQPTAPSTSIQPWVTLNPELFASKVYLHGFDDLSPFVRKWCDILTASGCEVTQMPAQGIETNASQKLQVFAASDPLQEVQQAAQWALSMAEQGKRVAVIAPDLATYKTPLITALDEQAVFAQQQALNLCTSHYQKSFNVSLGESLLQLPIVQNALLCVRLFIQPQRPLSYTDWSTWLCSPYAPGELAHRHAFDQSLRRLQWGRFSLGQLSQSPIYESQGRTVDWPEALSALRQSLLQWLTKQWPAKTNLSGFVTQLKACLETFGWPGDVSLNSLEFQQKTAFEEALQQFSQLVDIGVMHTSAWLKLLTRFLGEQIHQPKSQGREVIQILGMLEAAGQSFDALWMLGMTESDWPRAAQPNPFLPMHLQLEHQLPRADAHRELIYAQQVSKRLLQASSHIVLSYPEVIEAEEKLFSPLMQDFLEYGIEEFNRPVAITEFVLQPYFSIGQVQLNARDSLPQWVEDAQGEPLVEGSRAPGGTGILKAQSLCPLMAYIDYRLGAKYGFEAVEETLQQHNQGSLIHEVLEHFWQEFKNSKTLLSFSQERRQQCLQTIIDEVYLRNLPHADGNVLIAVEKQRVFELCDQWLQMEQLREPFEVQYTELETIVSLANIEFKVIVDRIDSTDQGVLVWDYKTGKASINELFAKSGEAMRAPQLAVYLWVLQHLLDCQPNAPEIAGLGYGLLHSDDGVKFQALMRDETALGEHFAKLRSVILFEKQSQKEHSDFYQMSWSQMLQTLQLEVEDIAQAIQQAEAVMAFSKQTDLAYSPGILALRLPEVQAQTQQIALQRLNASGASTQTGSVGS